MDFVPDHGFDDNLFPFDPDWANSIAPINGGVPDANQLCGEFDLNLASLSYLGLPDALLKPGDDSRRAWTFHLGISRLPAGS